MVTFKEDSFSITVETGVNPIEAWLDTHSELIDCLESEDEDKLSYRYHYLELLRQMMPDYDTALKLLYEKNM
jgi:hypothetical protein